MGFERYVETYSDCLSGLRKAHGEDEAMRLVVGGEFERVGALERDLLLTLGLKATDDIIDVGCGTGRFSTALAKTHQGRFTGVDILPELVEHAAKLANRPDWQFLTTSSASLPVPSGSADWITFFSVFTHLVDDDVYRYLQDAKRALKPTGQIIFSFLDFDIPNHWPLFSDSLADPNPKKVLTNFLDKRAIEVWVSRLGMRVQHFVSGDQRWIVPTTSASVLGSSELLNFGQSLAVVHIP